MFEELVQRVWKCDACGAKATKSSSAGCKEVRDAELAVPRDWGQVRISTPGCYLIDANLCPECCSRYYKIRDERDLPYTFKNVVRIFSKIVGSADD